MVSTVFDLVLASVQVPPVWALFFAMYNFGALLFGLLLIGSSEPRAGLSCGARLSPRKHPSWIIV